MDGGNKPKIFGLTYKQAIGTVAVVLAVLAVFLTWVSVSYGSDSKSYSGISGDFSDNLSDDKGFIDNGGIYILVFSIVCLAFILSDILQKVFIRTNQNLNKMFAIMNQLANIVVVVIGILIIVVTVADINAISSLNSEWSDYGLDINAGAGLYLALMAGFGIFISGVIGLKDQLPHMKINQQTQTMNNGVSNYPSGSPYSPSDAMQSQTTKTTVSNYCDNCGAQLSSGSKFCPSCGKQL